MGLNISTMYMDMEFEWLRKHLTYVNLNTTAASEHVPKIERIIRIIKERARSIYSTLPYKRIPGSMVIELIKYVVFWINFFPPNIRILATYSPRTTITGIKINFNNHCKLQFGAYVQAHEDRVKTNTIQEISHGEICLDPTGNLQGT